MVVRWGKVAVMKMINRNNLSLMMHNCTCGNRWSSSFYTSCSGWRNRREIIEIGKMNKSNFRNNIISHYDWNALRQSRTNSRRAGKDGWMARRGMASIAPNFVDGSHTQKNQDEETDTNMIQKSKKYETYVVKVAVLCGGPTQERGISLNSARSLYDHLHMKKEVLNVFNSTQSNAFTQLRYEVTLYYVNSNKQTCKLDTRDIYCNTPSDFDFKLRTRAHGGKDNIIDGDEFQLMDLTTLMKHLKGEKEGATTKNGFDIVFSALHGRFGEDGEIQQLLEDNGINFVGTSAAECRRAFDKYICSSFMKQNSYCSLPQFLCTRDAYEQDSDGNYGAKKMTATCYQELHNFFIDQGIDLKSGLVIVKPCRAGSSVGVHVVRGIADAVEKFNTIINVDKIDDRAIAELFLDRKTMKAKEFTTIIIDTNTENALALIPTEIKVIDPDEQNSLKENDESEINIFDYRRKYLPTTMVSYHTPPLFPEKVVESIRECAATLFKDLELKDFARIDGWFIPDDSDMYPTLKQTLTNNGKQTFGVLDNGILLFTDVNITSGMEQTSFLFQQAADCRMSHTKILQHILNNSIQRQNLVNKLSKAEESGEINSFGQDNDLSQKTKEREQTVFVIFGGSTSERQVSLMSGTNVWLKLRENNINALPFLLMKKEDTGAIHESNKCRQNNDQSDPTGDLEILYLPYGTVLRHTVEEVQQLCLNAFDHGTSTKQLRSRVTDSLRSNGVILSDDLNDDEPKRMTLKQLVQLIQNYDNNSDLAVNFRNLEKSDTEDSLKPKESANEVVVYIAVHGGVGEDGTIQNYFATNNVKYTGCRSECARLCMDKRLTSEALTCLESRGVYVSPKLTVTRSTMAKWIEDSKASGNDKFKDIWDGTINKLSLKSKSGTEDGTLQDQRRVSLCIKPALDGCSTGVAKLNSNEDLFIYCNSVVKCAEEIPGDLLSSSSVSIALPSQTVTDFIIEPFVETGKVVVSRVQVDDKGDTVGLGGGEEVVWDGSDSDWVEVTTGVMSLRELDGKMHSLNPSITVKEDGDILSLDEKFQGGTGINLTPPPSSIVPSSVLNEAKKRFELVAEQLQITGYSRIDAFMNVKKW